MILYIFLLVFVICFIDETSKAPFDSLGWKGHYINVQIIKVRMSCSSWQIRGEVDECRMGQVDMSTWEGMHLQWSSASIWLHIATWCVCWVRQGEEEGGVVAVCWRRLVQAFSDADPDIAVHQRPGLSVESAQ